MASRRNPRIVVLGSGPVGLAVAGSLRDRGFDVRVFEKRDHVPIAGGVIQLHVEGIYALKMLRGDSFPDLFMQNCETVMRSIEVTDLRKCTTTEPLGPRLHSIPLVDRYGPMGVLCTIRRSTLVSMLQSTLIGPLPVAAKECVRLVQRDNSVLVEFSDGTFTECEILIAADGVHSVARKLLFDFSRFRTVHAWCVGGVATLPAGHGPVVDPNAAEDMRNLFGHQSDADEDEGDALPSRPSFRLGHASSDDDSPPRPSRHSAPPPAQPTMAAAARAAAAVRRAGGSSPQPARGRPAASAPTTVTLPAAPLPPAAAATPVAPAAPAAAAAAAGAGPAPTVLPVQMENAAADLEYVLRHSSFTVAFSPGYRLYTCKCDASSVGWYLSVPETCPHVKSLGPAPWAPSAVAAMLRAVAAELKESGHTVFESLLSLTPMDGGDSPAVWEQGDIVPIPSFVRGSIALVGDAAHCMLSPNPIGQGVNQGLGDAAVLVDLLEEELLRVRGSAYAEFNVDHVLKTYSSRRQPLTAEFQRALRDSFVPFGSFAFFARVIRSDNFLKLALQPFDTFTRGLAHSSSDIDDSDAADIKADLRAITHNNHVAMALAAAGVLVLALLATRFWPVK